MDTLKGALATAHESSVEWVVLSRDMSQDEYIGTGNRLWFVT